MFLSYKPRKFLAVLLASLALSRCLAIPVTPPSTPMAKNLANAPEKPGAPLKSGKKPPLEITKFVAGWMRKSETRLRGAMVTKGGVEGWVQFDLEVETKLRYGLDPETPIKLREERVYGKTDDAADWVFAPGNSHKGLIVELKVQSSSQHGRGLAAKVKKDQLKISSALQDKYKDYDRTVLAIAWDKVTQTELEKEHMVAIPKSRINLLSEAHARAGNVIQLYQWTGELLKDGSQEQADNSRSLINPDSTAEFEGRGPSLAFTGSETERKNTPSPHSSEGTADKTPGNTGSPSKQPSTKPAAQAPDEKITKQAPGGATTGSKKPSTAQRIKDFVHLGKANDKGGKGDKKPSAGGSGTRPVA